jgi:hypothetical protein
MMPRVEELEPGCCVVNGRDMCTYISCCGVILVEDHHEEPWWQLSEHLTVQAARLAKNERLEADLDARLDVGPVWCHLCVGRSQTTCIFHRRASAGLMASRRRLPLVSSWALHAKGNHVHVEVLSCHTIGS